MSSWSDGALPLPRVRRLRKIRVLLLSHDRRFLQVAGFLLRRRGLFVETAANPERALELVERHAPDVVVLDRSGSISEVARSLGGIEALCPSVAVVVVSEQDEDVPPLRGFRLLPKWSAAGRLAAEVERAYFRIGATDELTPDAG
jgi:CheY-like chemotaxis protein